MSFGRRFIFETDSFMFHSAEAKIYIHGQLWRRANEMVFYNHARELFSVNIFHANTSEKGNANTNFVINSIRE